MLVLSRKPGENIRIDDDITLTVVEVQGNRVKLGIAAPRRHRILRGEVAAADAQHPVVFEVEMSPAVCTSCG